MCWLRRSSPTPLSLSPAVRFEAPYVSKEMASEINSRIHQHNAKKPTTRLFYYTQANKQSGNVQMNVILYVYPSSYNVKMKIIKLHAGRTVT